MNPDKTSKHNIQLYITRQNKTTIAVLDSHQLSAYLTMIVTPGEILLDAQLG